MNILIVDRTILGKLQNNLAARMSLLA